MCHVCHCHFLAERCGFTVFAFEFGFSEGFALDSWLNATQLKLIMN
jgi:erythromycin esterase-like protein